VDDRGCWGGPHGDHLLILVQMVGITKRGRRRGRAAEVKFSGGQDQIGLAELPAGGEGRAGGASFGSPPGVRRRPRPPGRRFPGRSAGARWWNGHRRPASRAAWSAPGIRLMSLPVDRLLNSISAERPDPPGVAGLAVLLQNGGHVAVVGVGGFACRGWSRGMAQPTDFVAGTLMVRPDSISPRPVSGPAWWPIGSCV